VNNNLAIALGKQGKTEQAIAAFRKVLEIDAGYPEAHQNLARLLAEAGSFDEAIAQFELALQASPESSELHNGLAVCLVRKRRVQEAVAHFRKALEINPAFTEAHFNLGDTLYYLQGNEAEALLHWRQVLRIDPNHVAVLNQAAWVLATSSDDSLRNGGEAVQLATRAAQLSGGRNPAILDTLAAACAEAGRFSEAVEITNRTLANAMARGDTRLAEAETARLALYQAGTPFHSPRPVSGER
jgi:tetratricopeptide (TPR) repeat protein